jgi:hypothetical protein
MGDTEIRSGSAIVSRRAMIGGLTAAAVMAPAFIRNMFAGGEPVAETTAGKVRGTFS